METIKRIYSSTAEFLEEVKQPPLEKTLKAMCREAPSSERLDYSFFKTSSYEEALNLAEFGFAQDSIRLQKALLKRQKHETARPVVKNDLRGSRASVGRFLAGQPNCMKRKVKTEAEKPVAKIMCDVSLHCKIDAEYVFKAGAILMNCIYTLERNGIRVELYAGRYTMSRSSNVEVQSFVKIKDATSPLNLNKVAFYVTHPSFARRLMFRDLERLPLKKKDGWYEYGYPNGEKHHGKQTDGCTHVSILKMIKDNLNEEDILKLF